MNSVLTRGIAIFTFVFASCSSSAEDRKLETSLSETSLEGYGNYSSVSLQSSATFLLHRHLSQFGAPSTRISSVYVMGQVVTVNLILREMDFGGFAIHGPEEVVVQFDLSEEQKSYILKRIDEVYYVTLRFRLTDEQVELLEKTAATLNHADLLFSVISDGKIRDEEAVDFYVWSRSYGFRCYEPN